MTYGQIAKFAIRCSILLKSKWELSSHNQREHDSHKVCQGLHPFKMENDNLNNNNSLPSTSFSKKFKRLDLSLMSKLLISFSNGKLSSVNSISISLISRDSDSTGSASHYNESMLYFRFTSEPNKSVSYFKDHSGIPEFNFLTCWMCVQEKHRMDQWEWRLPQRLFQPWCKKHIYLANAELTTDCTHRIWTRNNVIPF